MDTELSKRKGWLDSNKFKWYNTLFECGATTFSYLPLLAGTGHFTIGVELYNRIKGIKGAHLK
jgi:hypothetical protein